MSSSHSQNSFGPSEPPSGPSLMDAWNSGLYELGGYQLTRPVGSGGMGAVFEALEKQTGRRVALKTLHRTDPGGLIALKGEFRRMADVVHRNLALLHELVQDGELLYFAMEFVEGVDFYRYVTGSTQPNAPTLLAGDPEADPISRPKPLAVHRFRERRLRNSLIQLASGVMALHQEGLLHLDLKPANVLVENGGRVVILDFGLVRPQSGGLDSTLFCGTPAYMAPEQAEGRAGPPADVYAIGVMLFEALTGDLPFDVRGHAGIFGKLRNEAPPASARRPDLPRDLDELCAELLAREPGKRPSVDTIVKRLMPSSSVRLQPLASLPVSSPSAGRSELVGRDVEIELMFDAFEQCRSGEAAQVYIDGLSGVGKTALLQRFVDRVAREYGTLVLEARCYERESIPYKAVDALIDSLAPHLSTRLHAAAGDLNDVLRVFPALAASTGGQLPALPLAGDPHEARRRAFRGLRALLADLARERPLVLAVDDLQWGDLDSARLLVEVLAPPSAPPVLFVGTYRSEERKQSAFLEELLRRGVGPEVTLITLSPLSFADAEALALDLLGRNDDDARRVAREVAGESGGNPLLIDSLVSHRASSGAGASTAPSLEAVVLAAMANLPPEARRLLELVTVAGRPLPQGLALEAAAVGSERHAVLARLRTAHLVRTRGTGPTDPLDVYHDRIREVLYAHLPRLTLRSLHRHLANALEAQGDAHADLLARQFNAAGVVEKAGHYATVAAERASAALAFDQAAELFTLAVECRPDDLELNVRHAEALVQAGHGAEAAHAFLACARSAPPERALVLERSAARQLLFAGHVEEGIGLLRPILAHFRLWLPGSPLGLGLALVWRLLRAALRGTDFVLRPVESIGRDELSRIDTAISVADGLSSIDLVRAGAVMLDALHLALRSGERSRIAWTLAQYGLFTATKGTARAVARGEELLARAENLGRGFGDANLEGAFKLAWAKAALAIGDFRAALSRADACAEHLRSQCASAAGPISVAQNVSLMALECLGDFGELRLRAQTNLELAATLGDRYVQVTSLAFLADGRIAAGDTSGARAALREGRKVWSARGFMLQNWLMLAAEASLALYEAEPLRAWTLLEQHWPAVTASRLLDVQLLRVFALRLRGNIALACLASSAGPTRRLIARTQKDAEYLERQTQGHARAAAGVLRAGIAWFEGDSERAGLALTRAIASYEQAGMAVAANSARLRRSLLSGHGGTDAANAVTAMRERGIAEPDRYAKLHAP